LQRSAILRHCSQAEAQEAAVAQIAAQSPTDDNKTTIHKASLVLAKAASRPDLSVRDALCRNLRSLTE
jgi:hypothetical protein